MSRVAKMIQELWQASDTHNFSLCPKDKAHNDVDAIQ